LSLENAVARILVDSPTLDAAIPLVLQSICESLEWELGAFWAVDERFGVLHYNTTWHSGSDAMTQFAALSSQITFPAGVGLPGRVFASGEPLWISDVVKDTNFPRARAAEQLGLHAAFAFPIRRMGKVLGVMEFFSRKIQRRDEDLLQMLSAIGSLIALVIESKQTYTPVFGEVAYDFNNLLTVITGYSEYLLNRLTDQRDPLGLEIQRVKNAGDIAAFLTRQFLSFNRRQPGHPGVLDLNAVVSEMEKTLKLIVGKKIDLVTALRSGLGQVKADLGQIEKIVMNLVIHARDAMPNGGSLTIETSNVELDEIFARFHPETRQGSYVMLAVTGTGGTVDVGIPTRFEQFFTAPSEGDERGTGLANVYSIVKNHEGVISVSNNGTTSSTIKIYLPRLETPSRAEELV
jgi:signal transduction histidine kinase